ncbi:MAG: hypothetical protein H6Q90_6453, partial [Deltaproteobacteria bacterium]|nr:hypothetical protein [Deltaproteobacteria bacterium]
MGLAALLYGCASGTPNAEQVDASNTDAKNPDPVADARPDSTTAMPDGPLPPDACVPMAIEKLANPVFDLTPNGMGWVDGR